MRRAAKSPQLMRGSLRQQQPTLCWEASLRRPLTAAILVLFSLSACSERKATRDPGSSYAGEGVPRLDTAKVPADLRDLVPFAQRWGIGDDVARSEGVQKAPGTDHSLARQLRTGSDAGRGDRLHVYPTCHRGNAVGCGPHEALARLPRILV